MTKHPVSTFFSGIDLSSDTATQPTLAMKKAMLTATLGDEQKAEDPTTRQLEKMVAELLGLEEALFFPSATMANQVAIRLHCEPGDELIAAENCHLFVAECGGPAIHSSVMPRAIRTQTGLFTPDDILAVYRQSTSPHHTNSSCLSIENTTNMGGGLAWELTTLNAALAMAQQLKLKTHLDGARLFNAAIKMNVKPELLTSDFDTVTLCLSKGLGCPIGAVLAFQKKDAIKVRRLKHLFGGAMRQTGMLAAAGIYALEHNIERLRQDHENAEYFSKQINLQVPFIRVECQPFSTNMVFFEWLGKNLSTNQFYEACLNKGIRFSQAGANRFRAVTHLGISSHDIDTVVNALKKLN